MFLYYFGLQTNVPMNKLILRPFTAILCTSILLIGLQTGCKKSSNGSSAAVSASFGSSSFSSQQSQAFYSKSQGLIGIVGYTISGGDTTALELDLSSTITVGTPVSFASGTSVYYYDTKGSISFTGDPTEGHGTVTLTSWDSTNLKLTGTFTGVLQSDLSPTDSVVVSGGQFTVSYLAEP